MRTRSAGQGDAQRRRRGDGDRRGIDDGDDGVPRRRSRRRDRCGIDARSRVRVRGREGRGLRIRAVTERPVPGHAGRGRTDAEDQRDTGCAARRYVQERRRRCRRGRRWRAWRGWSRRSDQRMRGETTGDDGHVRRIERRQNGGRRSATAGRGLCRQNHAARRRERDDHVRQRRAVAVLHASRQRRVSSRRTCRCAEGQLRRRRQVGRRRRGRRARVVVAHTRRAQAVTGALRSRNTFMFATPGLMVRSTPLSCRWSSGRSCRGPSPSR